MKSVWAGSGSNEWREGRVGGESNTVICGYKGNGICRAGLGTRSHCNT